MKKLLTVIFIVLLPKLLVASKPPGWDIFVPSLSESSYSLDSAGANLTHQLNSESVKILLKLEPMALLLAEMAEETIRLEKDKAINITLSSNDTFIKKFSNQLDQVLEKRIEPLDFLVLVGVFGKHLTSEEQEFRETMRVSDYVFTRVYEKYGDKKKNIEQFLLNSFGLGLRGYLSNSGVNGAAMILGARGGQKLFDRMFNASSGPFVAKSPVVSAAMDLMHKHFDPSINPKWVTLRGIKNDIMRPIVSCYRAFGLGSSK